MAYLPYTTKTDFVDTIEAADVNNLQSNISDLSFNVKGYGAVGDGSTDDTTAVQAAIDAAATAGGGVVWFPKGTYVCSTLTWKSQVYGVGAGMDTSIIQLKASTNANLITGLNFSTLTSGDTVAGIHDFGLRDIALDGNKTQNTSGWGFQFYGYRPFFTNVFIHDCKSGGLYSQGFTSTDPISNRNRYGAFMNLEVASCDGDGIYFNGIGDSTMTDCVIHDNSAVGLNIASRGVGIKVLQTHIYGNAHDHCVKIAATGVKLTGCTFEGSDGSLVLLQSGGDSCQIVGCHLFAAGTQTTKAGVEINGVNGFFIVGSYFVNLTDGSVKLTSDSGGGMVASNYLYQTSGSAFAGTPHKTTYIRENDVQGGALGGAGGTATIASGAATAPAGDDYFSLEGEGATADTLSTLTPEAKGRIRRFLALHAITVSNYNGGAGGDGSIITGTGADVSVPQFGVYSMISDDPNWIAI